MTKEIELAKQHGIQYRLTPEGTTEMWCYDRDLQAFAEALVAAERERLLGAMLSTPNLMHACDALGVPANVEYCDLLRRALYRA